MTFVVLLDPAMAPLLNAWDLTRMDQEATVAYAYWSDGRLAYANEAYVAQGRAARGDWLSKWGLGSVVWGAISGPMRERYEQASAQVLRTGQQQQMTYLCPTPQIHRRMSLRMYPLGSSAVLTVHAVVWEQPLTAAEAEREALEARYVDERGFVTQCASCRHVRRPGTDTWEFVPKWLTDPLPNTSHGLCESCQPHWGYGKR